MNTEIVVAILGSCFMTAILLGGIYAAIRFAQAGRELIRGLHNIKAIADSNRELVETSRMVATELQLLRSLMAANVQPQAPGQDPREGEAPPTPPRPRPPFPMAPADLYREAPDAEESDTVITDTTDEQLVEMEKLEEIRKQGYEADPAELEER